MDREERIDPHRERRRQVMRAHPELAKLMGPYRATAAWIALLVIAQVGIAAWLTDTPWWAVLLAAYAIGAPISLALWALLHETTHDLIFKRENANRWMGIVAGLPLAIPAASGFRTCHLLHHRHLGDPLMDGDFASAWEARLVGGNPAMKALWLLAQPLLLSLRPRRMPGVRLVDRWFFANLAAQAAFDVAVLWLLGWGALAYLMLGNLFALGLHPLGGRWIQEHYIVDPRQTTYSYYGRMNGLVFNCGYHSEHHDLMRVPWVHLPEVKRIAPEIYGQLHAHHSWTALLLRFLFDRHLTLTNRAFGSAEAWTEGRVRA